MIEPKIDVGHSILPAETVAAAATDDFSGNYFSVREGMTKREISEPARRILEALLALAFLEGRTEAPVRSLELLARSAFLHKGNLRRFLKELINSDIIVERCESHCWYYEIKPDWHAWKCPRKFSLAEERVAEKSLKQLLEAPDPGQLELIAREPNFDAEVSRAFSSSSVRAAPASVVHRTTADPDPGRVVHCTTRAPTPGSRTPYDSPPVGIVTGTGQAKACQYPVHPVQATGHRPAVAGIDEQLDRLERILGAPPSHRNWWNKHGGKSHEALKAMRQTMDDFVTNREPIRDPSRWLVKVFKNKLRAAAR